MHGICALSSATKPPFRHSASVTSTHQRVIDGIIIRTVGDMRTEFSLLFALHRFRDCFALAIVFS